MIEKIYAISYFIAVGAMAATLFSVAMDIHWAIEPGAWIMILGFAISAISGAIFVTKREIGV